MTTIQAGEQVQDASGLRAGPLLRCISGQSAEVLATQRSGQTLLSELVAEACTQFSVSEEALLSRSSQRRLMRVHDWIAHQAIRRRIA